MKRKIIAVSALLAVLLAGGYAVQAGPMGKGHHGQQAEAGGHGCRSRMNDDQAGCLGHIDQMTETLGLSDSQRQDVEAIMTAQQEDQAPLKEKIVAGQQQLWEAAQDGEIDETKVKALADEQARLMSEMMVSRIRMKSQIFAILTPEQREKAEELGERCGLGGPACGGPGGGPRGGCGHKPGPGGAAGKAAS